MRFFTKAVCAVLAVFALSVGASFGMGQQSNARELTAGYTYLIAGLDDAAQNTDVISVMNISKEGRISLLQIPRDTYINRDGKTSKLNAFYPSSRRDGASAEEGMKKLSDLVSELLAVNIDGYVALTVEAFHAIIARLGGVDIELQAPIRISDELTLGVGKNHLDADTAVRLVRHRASYKRADLDRLDIQGLFYTALFDKILDATVADVLAIYKAISSDGTVSLSLSDAVKLFGMREAMRVTSIKKYTLPGLAAPDNNGVWYYFVKRSSAASLVGEVFGADFYKFDKNEILLNKTEQKFIDIYNS
ncbi:MAG: LCP family protein [Clostridia bacterium]|nr:LCP family protein [Clostridia bacterium]